MRKSKLKSFFGFVGAFFTRLAGPAVENTGVYVKLNPGDLTDRATIAQIKTSKAQNDSGFSKVSDYLTSLIPTQVIEQQDLLIQLMRINQSLWTAEDNIRAAIKAADQSAIADWAVNICRLNDDRTHLKRKIDALCDTNSSEVKIYS